MIAIPTVYTKCDITESCLAFCLLLHLYRVSISVNLSAAPACASTALHHNCLPPPLLSPADRIFDLVVNLAWLHHSSHVASPCSAGRRKLVLSPEPIGHLSHQSQDLASSGSKMTNRAFNLLISIASFLTVREPFMPS